MTRVIVDVMLKPEIHDPQGEAVLSASHRLGFAAITGVRQGKRFEVDIDGPADEAMHLTLQRRFAVGCPTTFCV